MAPIETINTPSACSRMQAEGRNKHFVYRVLAVTAVLIALSFGGLGLWVFKSSGDALRAEISAEISSVGSLAADGVRYWLRERVTLVRGLAEDAADAQDEAVQGLVRRKVQAEPFSEVYFGRENDGGFVTNNTAPLPAGYDPRKRPWYAAAVQAKTLTFSKPYTDVTTKKLVISVAQPVYAGSALRGVAAADMPLDALQRFLGDIRLDGKGFVFLVDDAGTVLVHPDAGRVMQPSGFDPKMPRSESDDGAEIVRFYPISGLSGVKWHVGVSMDSAKVFAPLRTLGVVMVVAVLAAMAVVLPLLGFVLLRLVSRPVVQMTSAMTALSRGETDVEIPGLDRRDELGAMAGALEVFKRNAQEIQHLQAEQERMRREAEDNRRTLLERLAGDFESQVSGVVRDVLVAARAMEDQAKWLGEDMEKARQGSDAVAASTEETSANMQTVAAATEELSASIDEIARRVTESAEIATRTAVGAEDSCQTIEELARQTANVGNIVSLINAQIEATQKATEKAVAEIRAISTVAQQAKELAASIASTVEEQGVATREISQNVNRAASGAQHVATNIQQVGGVVVSAAERAGEVRVAAEQLVDRFAALEDQVRVFLGNVRSA